MNEKDFSMMSEAELKEAYSAARAQIDVIQHTIDDLCDNAEVSTIYKYDENGQIVTAGIDELSKSEALYEMEEIVRDLQGNLDEIEEYYTGTDLESTPILGDIPNKDSYEDVEDAILNDGSIKGRKI